MRLLSLVRGCCAVLTLLVLLAAPKGADAYVITVAGQPYDVVPVAPYNVNGAAFVDHIDVLTHPVTAPWWNQGLAMAQDFANGLAASADKPATGSYLFAYATSHPLDDPSAAISYAWYNADVGFVSTGHDNARSILPANQTYMIVNAAVPEIDGAVLAQAALVLLALYMASAALRRRGRLA